MGQDPRHMRMGLQGLDGPQVLRQATLNMVLFQSIADRNLDRAIKRKSAVSHLMEDCNGDQELVERLLVAG